MQSYGSSLNTATSRPRTRSASPRRSSSVATPAGRVVRAVQEHRLRTRVLSEEATNIVEVRPERVRRPQARQHHPRAAPGDVRRVGREIRAEHQHAVVRLQKRLTEQLLEGLRPRSGDDMVGGDRQTVLLVEVGGRRSAKLRQPDRRTVAGATVADGLDPRLEGPVRRRERAVADLQLYDVLTGGDQPPGDGEHGEGALGLDRGRETREGRRHRSGSLSRKKSYPSSRLHATAGAHLCRHPRGQAAAVPRRPDGLRHAARKKRGSPDIKVGPSPGRSDQELYDLGRMRLIHGFFWDLPEQCFLASVDGRLRRPRSGWGACSAAAKSHRKVLNR